MQKKKVPTIVKVGIPIPTNNVNVKCLRIKTGSIGGYMGNGGKTYDINVDEINGESASVNSFIVEVRTLCEKL